MSFDLNILHNIIIYQDFQLVNANLTYLYQNL